MASGFILYSLSALLMFSSVIMILLVLIQRGRGGGLAGAFGGMGGQSALGVRAGDVFTKITIVVAVVWVTVAGLLGISMRSYSESQKSDTIFAGAPETPTKGAEGESVPETLKGTDPVKDTETPKDGNEKQPAADGSKAGEDPAKPKEDAADPAADENKAAADAADAPKADGAPVEKPADSPAATPETPAKPVDAEKDAAVGTETKQEDPAAPKN